MRFVQVDVLRGFAVLGIYWINIFVFALPVTLGPLPAELNDNSTINSIIGIVSDVYVEGTMRALFSMLFGASALIFLDEARLATSGLDLVDRYYRRSLLLILFGLIHAYVLLWPYDVLYAYGLFGLFLFPLRKLSARTLLICAMVLLVLGDLKMESEIPVSDTSAKQTYGEESAEEIPINVAIAAYRSDYATVFTIQRSMVIEKQSMAIYQEYIFDIGGMMLMGMALWKMGVFSGQITPYLYLVLTILGYVTGVLVRYGFALVGPDSHSGLNFTGYNLGRLLITVGHIGLIGLLCHSDRLKPVTNLLASVGRMALTNYLMQTVISIFLFYGIGFALYAQLERYEVALIGVCVWLFQIVYSNLWLAWFKQGPLEWLWRSTIYGKLLPNRRIVKTD